MKFVSTILCVDDDEDDLYFIRDVIHSYSFTLQIEEAKNGLDALHYLEGALVNESLPCLIIMDMNMPRMDGKQTIKKIMDKEQLSRIPIVVFTTSSNVDDKLYFESKGIHFITKPFEYKVFTNQIIDLLAFCADLGS